MLSGNNLRKLYGVPCTNCRGRQMLGKRFRNVSFKAVRSKYLFFFQKGKETLAFQKLLNILSGFVK